MSVIEGEFIRIFGITMNPPKGVAVGSLHIYFYGLLIACGMLLAVIYACKRCKQFGYSADDLTDGVLCIVPFAIICARLYYCAFKWDDYKGDWLSILEVWNGGLAIYGGVIGAVIGVAVFSRVKKLKFGAVMDLVVLGLLIGQCIGRWGNFFNREAYGSEISENLFWAMGLSTDGTNWEWHHPTFLYESLWNLAGFVGLHFLSKKRQYDGQIALGYTAWYGLGRTFIEGLRTDSLYLTETIRVSQLLAAVTCFAAVGVLLFMAFRKHDPAKMQVNITAARSVTIEPQKESGMEPLILDETGIVEQTEAPQTEEQAPQIEEQSECSEPISEPTAQEDAPLSETEEA